MSQPAADGAVPARRVVVERHYDRLLVTIGRRRIRVFSLSLDEAEDLAGELRAQLAEAQAGRGKYPDPAIAH